MRITVISDSHGNGSAVDRILRREKDSNAVVFLGDVTSDIEDFVYEYTDKKFYIVSGNCDFFSHYPHNDIINVADTKIFITHGHTFGVKGGTAALEKAARQSGCKIAMYGHTHIPYIKYENGLYIVNPGSCSRPRDGGPTYAAVDIRKNGILPAVIKL